MGIDFPEFDWRTMTEMILQIPRAPMLLQDKIFRKRNTNVSEYVDVDVVIGGRKVLPFVSNYSGGTVIEKLSGQMRSVKTPRLNPKKPFTAHELLSERAPGMHFYGTSGDVQTARQEKLVNELADIRNRVDTTIEYMCAMGLRGGYTVTNEGHEFSIDFNMPSANKPVLGAGSGWNEVTTAAPILANIRDWSTRLISDKVGVGPTIALCGTNVVNALLGNDGIVKLLDNRNINIGQLTYDPNGNFLGRLGTVELYHYGNSYTGLDGVDHRFIDDDAFVLVAPQARFSVEFGPIFNLNAGGNIVSEFFSYSWPEKDGKSLWMTAESSPLPVMWQPEAVVYADVIV